MSNSFLVLGTGRWPWFCVLGAMVCVLTGSEAIAQSSQPPVEPDVLLLLDTADGMGRTSLRLASSPSKQAPPLCATYPAVKAIDRGALYDPSANVTPSDKWAWVVEALTGTVVGAGCTAQSRSSAEFLTEFGLVGAPADASHGRPFNRLVARKETVDCVAGPTWDTDIQERLRSNSGLWGTEHLPPNDPRSPIVWRVLDPGGAISTRECPFTPQLGDGILDQYRASVRFGVMTFDGLTGSETDMKPVVTGTGRNPQATDLDEATFWAALRSGVWSYYPNWQSSSAQAVAGPAYTSSGVRVNLGSPFEVGARNHTALPWEGRLIGFGWQEASAAERATNNERIQQVISTIRPWGTRPTAGLLQDAYWFLTSDQTNEGPGRYVGGAVDSSVWRQDRSRRGCRRRVAVLITDGVDNFDGRPYCEADPTANGSEGGCAYRTAPQIAQDLYDRNVDLKVVAVGVNGYHNGQVLTCEDVLTQGSPNYRSCESLTPCTAHACPSGNACNQGYCVANTGDALVINCCTLDAIARAGSGSERGAYYAHDVVSLRQAMASILSGVSTGTFTTTQAVYATGQFGMSDTMGQIVGAQFYSSYEANGERLARGYLTRERYTCSAAEGGLKKEEISVDKGDSFGTNLDQAKDQRIVFSVEAEATAGKLRSYRSIRPGCKEAGACTDGLSQVRGTRKGGSSLVFSRQFAPGAMFDELSDHPNAYNEVCRREPGGSPATPEACAEFIWRVILGYQATAGATVMQRSSALGGIKSGSPLVVMAPNEYLRDGSYLDYQSLFAKRLPVLYAATTDGQLHAFSINRLDNQLNELWSFVPPAMLPLAGMYLGRGSDSDGGLLRGSLSVGEVAGGEANSSDSAAGQFLTREAPREQRRDDTQWYTILVGSFASLYGDAGYPSGFYALDITNPSLEASGAGAQPGAHYAKGPRMLWQLTTDNEGQPLFGISPGKAAITTLYFKAPGQQQAAQHAVAILPGGDGGVRPEDQGGTPVVPSIPTRVKLGVTPRRVASSVATGGAAHAPSRVSLAGARSLTVVKLDTGEVVRTFRNVSRSGAAEYDAADPQAPKELYDSQRVTSATFPAPMTGHVVAYPTGAGVVSDRAYVGDAAGLLWRMDLASADPSQWKVDLIHDTFPAAGPGAVADLNQPRAFGAAIESPVIVSTDLAGNVTLAVATGRQQGFTDGKQNSVWSLTERRDASGILEIAVNWYFNSTNSARTSRGAGDSGLAEGHFRYAGSYDAASEQVTGPMSLFGSRLYFTTYVRQPALSDQCDPGRSYLWAVHYAQAGPDANTVSGVASDGGQPQLLEDSSSSPRFVHVKELSAPGMAFGVGLVQKPSCWFAETSGPVWGSAHQGLSSIAAGSMELQVQLGLVSGQADRGVDLVTAPLPAPTAGGSIDAWAPILN